MKKIKALCYTNAGVGILAYMCRTPAKEITERTGVKHYSCNITLSDKEYKKLKNLVDRVERDQKLFRKNYLKNRIEFKLVKA